MIDPGNTPSLRLARRAGYREFHHSTYKDAPVVLFERPAPAR
jgi:RimJ/RimL family protein N-acetyltransferase